MDYVGYDGQGNKLRLNDICVFQLQSDGSWHEGMIVYDEDTFSYCFEMNDDTFPIVIMDKAERQSIKVIANVWSTSVKDERYKWYQEIAKHPDI